MTKWQIDKKWQNMIKNDKKMTKNDIKCQNMTKNDKKWQKWKKMTIMTKMTKVDKKNFSKKKIVLKKEFHKKIYQKPSKTQ